MAFPQRVRGSEVSIVILRDSQVEAQLVDIQNFNFEVQSETKIQGYLGEPSNRVDDIYNQTKLDFEMNNHSPDWQAFVQAILDRQARRTPDIVFNIAALFFYPSGETRTITFPDCKFGAIPINISSRGDYVKWKFDAVCEAPVFEAA